MLSVSVETAVFTEKLREYQSLVKRAMSDVLKEQARFLAERLTKLTFPTSQKQGRKRVAIDIGRVYLSNKWFEEIFQWKNQKLGQRVKDAVYAGDSDTLRGIFENSPRLNRIRIEPFDREKHRALRRNGRVLVPNPYSFPVDQQSAVTALLKEKQKNVGLAKRGWANCSAALGKSVPQWLATSGAGEVKDNSEAPSEAYIILSNKIAFFSALDSKANIVSRALQGRARDMIKSAERQLAEAAKQAGLQH